MQETVHRLDLTASTAPPDIAIVGMSCRFSGAPDLESYWRLLVEGRPSFAPVPAQRWNHAPFFDPDNRRSAHTAYTDQVAFVDDADRFAPLHYGLTPRRVQAMDPQQRMLIDVTREALQDAGWERAEFDRATTGVFVGMSVSEYKDLASARLRAIQLADGSYGSAPSGVQEQLEASAERVRPLHAYSLAGTLLNMAPCSISQIFDLGGPSFAIDAACSSSLVALHEALLHLRTGRCGAAIVGGAYLNLTPDTLVGFSRIGALSAAGVCRPFDRRSDGFVLGEGIGAVVLRPLDDALAAGDRVYAVLKGSGVSNDGTAEGPMTPRAGGQVEALRRAYVDAGVPASSVGFFEAHGTATSVGDRVELDALRQVRAESAADGPTELTPAYLSAGKALIGHTLGAAGIAALIKTALVLHHRIVVPQPDIEPSADLDLGQAGLVLAAEAVPWTAEDGATRRAAISSFGFGGTNVHAVLEESPPPPPRVGDDERPRLLLLSAGSIDLLASHALSIARAIEATPSITVADVARTLWTRQLLDARLAVVAASRAELLALLRTAADALMAGRVGRLADGVHAAVRPLEPGDRGIAFVYPGQGSQRPGMAHDLIETFPPYLDELRRLNAGGAAQTDDSVFELLTGPDDQSRRSLLAATATCQPAVVTAALAATRLLEAVGVTPDVTLGHSVGEFAAAAAAGALSPEAATALVIRRGAVMQALEATEHGAMLAVRTNESGYQRLAAGIESLDLACVNGERSLVASGRTAAIEELERRCAQSGVAATRLAVSNAFHSRLLAPADEHLAQHLAEVAVARPTRSFISTVSGQPADHPEMLRDLWGHHASRPVRFAEAVQSALDAGARIFVQVSGGRSLRGHLADATSGIEASHVITLDSDTGDSARAFLTGLGVLAALGLEVNPAGLGQPQGHIVSLPTAPLLTGSYWVLQDPRQPERREPVGAVVRDDRPLGYAEECSEPVGIRAATRRRSGASPLTVADQLRSSVPDSSGVPMTARVNTPVSDIVSLMREQIELLARLGGGELTAGSEIFARRLQAEPELTPIGLDTAGQNRAIDGQPFARGGSRTAQGVPAEPLVAQAHVPDAEAAVLEHLARVSAFPIDDLHLDQSLVADLGFDSIMTMDFGAALERTFPGLELGPEMLNPTVTAADVARAVRLHVNPLTVLAPSAPEEEPVREDRATDQPTTSRPAQQARPEEFAELVAHNERLLLADKLQVRNPYFIPHQRVLRDTTMIEGREYISFSGYNYLGLSGDARVTQAVKDAVDRYGTSVSASRLLSGDRPLHRSLEAELAGLLKVEDTVTLVSGHATNVSVIGHIVGPGDLIVHDALAHDSIRQGCKLSGATRRPFPHNDVDALDQILTSARAQFRRVLIVVEGVYSMDGDIADLPQLLDVKRRHGALLMIDEAHSIGVLGGVGGGIGDHFGVDRTEVDLWCGTMSKALAGCGGYIGGSAGFIDYLRYTVPGFVYSVGMTPANAAASLAAIEVMRDEPGRLHRLRENSRLFLQLARQAGADTGESSGSPVVPCVVGDSAKSVRLADALFRRGISVNPIMYPAVEEKLARLRFFVTSEHTEDQIRQTTRILGEELRRLGVTPSGHVLPAATG